MCVKNLRRWIVELRVWPCPRGLTSFDMSVQPALLGPKQPPRPRRVIGQRLVSPHLQLVALAIVQAQNPRHLFPDSAFDCSHAASAKMRNQPETSACWLRRTLKSSASPQWKPTVSACQDMASRYDTPCCRRRKILRNRNDQCTIGQILA